jgi:hypothetical protein
MKRLWQKKIIAVVLGLSLVLIPVTARAGVTDIITLLNTISSTIQNAIGEVLAQIESINADVRQMQQELVWPLALIDQTRSFVAQIRSELGRLTAQIHAITVSSATLASPKQLESLLRGGQSSGLPQLQPAFSAVFGQVPAPADAGATDRNLIDMDDAAANDAFKTAVMSDQSTDQMLAVADAVERQTTTSAPGSAPMLAAQAEISSLESQALLQKVLAAELRQEAIRVAHENMLRKQSAAATRNLNNHLQQILTRP